MIKKVINVIKKIIISSFLLYGYNLIVQPLGLIIPINIITIGAVSLFGVPALLSLIFMLIFVY